MALSRQERYELKQARRKQNRELRKHGLEVLQGEHWAKLDKSAQIGKLQRTAEREVRLRTSLNHTIDNGAGSERAAAAKAKRKLNDKWFNRSVSSITGYWDNTQKPGVCIQVQA